MPHRLAIALASGYGAAYDQLTPGDRKFGRRLYAAALRDILGLKWKTIADLCEYRDAYSAQHRAAEARPVWREIGAWPWSCFPARGVPPTTWAPVGGGSTLREAFAAWYTGRLGVGTLTRGAEPVARTSPRPVTGMSDKRVERWTESIDGPIKRDVLMTFHHRQIWEGIAEIIREHGSLPDSAFWRSRVDVYARSQAMRVRGQASDLRKDVASLARLVQGVAKHPGALTADWWWSLWGSDDGMDQAFARRQWESEYGSEARPDRFDRERARKDFQELQAAAAKVKKYVDTHVAHSKLNATPADAELTLNEIHEAIDVVGETYRRYYSLFTAASWHELAPVIQHDWEAPFRVRWIEPKPPPHER